MAFDGQEPPERPEPNTLTPLDRLRRRKAVLEGEKKRLEAVFQQVATNVSMVTAALGEVNTAIREIETGDTTEEPPAPEMRVAEIGDFTQPEPVSHGEP